MHFLCKERKRRPVQGYDGYDINSVSSCFLSWQLPQQLLNAKRRADSRLISIMSSLIASAKSHTKERNDGRGRAHDYNRHRKCCKGNAFCSLQENAFPTFPDYIFSFSQLFVRPMTLRSLRLAKQLMKKKM